MNVPMALMDFLPVLPLGALTVFPAGFFKAV